ncbi:MAG: Structural maintenance of chromosomes protein 6 [Thelocarpon impressellum]|nr:MAG: Structural maintenance of chromosomes protein 6 [Thelocarpon impressellum]
MATTVVSARSQLRHEMVTEPLCSCRKKARLSDVRPAGYSRKSREDEVRSDVASDEGPEAEDRERENDVSEAEGDDHERRRDAGFEDLANEDMDTQRATQVIQQRNRRSVDNIPSDSGIIESVTCINFMCHSKLHVPLGPLMNFIIGHNGSGKSAVLTALTLCLGGKASSTNRGQNLKSFIKEGEETATIVVKIKNSGNAAYQPETYGDSIVVERHFSRTGASNFRLKSASSRNISTRKAELEEICDYFALQIDNPMNVLTQDMARQFLNSSTATDKYRFFLKGVQLTQLDQDYELLGETIEQIQAKLASRAEDIKVVEERARKAAARWERWERQNTMRDRFRNFQRQMAWAQVVQEEQTLEKHDRVLEDADHTIMSAEAKAETAEQHREKTHNAAEIANEDVLELRGTLSPLQERKIQAKARFNENKTELLSIQTQQRSIRDHLKDAEKRILKAQADIERENERLEAANGGGHSRRVAEIEEARAKVTEAKVQYDEHHAALPSLEAELHGAERGFKDAYRPIEFKKVELRQCEDLLQTLTRNRGEDLGAFHENMPRLLRAIREEIGFRERPVGPVGNHIRLKKPLWSSILEKSLGGALNSFIVTSKSDQSLLSNVMRRMNCVCPILIGNNQTIDTSRNEPDARFDTTLRVLEIDNDLVRRQLIINQGIEQTILIENLKEANRTMYDGPRLRNVRQCYCINDQRRGWGIRLGYGQGGEPSSSPMRPMTGKPRMKTDTETQISYQKETRQQLRRELTELEGRADELRDRFKSCERAIARHQRDHRDLQVRVRRSEELVERLQDDFERENAEDGRLQVLKDGLTEAEEEKRLNEETYQSGVTQKDKLNHISKSLTEEVQAADREIEEHQARIKKAESRALKMQTARAAAVHERDLAYQDVNTAKLKKSRVEMELERQALTVSAATELALRVSPRVDLDPGEDADSLELKLNKMEKDLKRIEREIGGSREAVVNEAAETTRAFQTARQQFNDLEDLKKILEYCLTNRQHRWREFRRFISARARAQFTYLLSERGFRGSLKTDHRLGTLDLHVQPDETKTDTGRQTKTLSGGEKSFATICLLLALWEAMGSPIRCLDEFDVFMDNINRDISLKMMISTARRSMGRQYILITPQSMGSVDVSDDIRIIKLSDPERGQTTLPFGK